MRVNFANQLLNTLCVFVFAASASAQSLEVTTFAGAAGVSGTNDGPRLSSRFGGVSSVAVGADGYIYVGDETTGVRRISPSGDVTTLTKSAGYRSLPDGINTKYPASPHGLALDRANNLYLTDHNFSTPQILRVSPDGIVVKIAGSSYGGGDGPTDHAQFAFPSSLAIASDGSIFVADSSGHTIRKITSTGMVTTIAGVPGAPGYVDGPAAFAQFAAPKALVLHTDGAIYITDSDNHTIRKLANGTVTTLAGLAGVRGNADGNGSAARFNVPWGLTVDGAGNLFVVDQWNATIRRVTTSGDVTTVAGLPFVYGAADGIGSDARFKWPRGIAASGDGSLYIADTQNWFIRRAVPVSAKLTLDSSTDTSLSGETVTFTATVVAAATGSIRFERDGVILRTAPVAGGSALFSTSELPVGTHALRAVYSGDGTYPSETKEIEHVVTPLVAPAQPSAAASGPLAVLIRWNGVVGAVSYQVLRRQAGSEYAVVAETDIRSLNDTSVAAKQSYAYVVRAVDANGNVSPMSVPDVATTFAFTDDPLVAGTTVVRAVHVNEIRDAVNAVRTLAGLAPIAGSNVLEPRVTRVRAAELRELRANLRDALTALQVPVSYSTTDPIWQLVRAVDYQDLRSAVR